MKMAADTLALRHDHAAVLVWMMVPEKRWRLDLSYDALLLHVKPVVNLRRAM